MLQGIQNQLLKFPLQQEFSLVAPYPATFRENQKQNIQSDRQNEIPQEISPTPFKLTNPRVQLYDLLSKNPFSFDIQLKQSATVAAQSSQSLHNQSCKESHLQSLVIIPTIIQSGDQVLRPSQSNRKLSSDRSFPSYGWQLKRQQSAKQKPRHQPLSIKKRPSVPVSLLVNPVDISIGRMSVQTPYPRVYDKQIAMQFQYPERVNDFVIEPFFELLPFEGFQLTNKNLMSQPRFVTLFGDKEGKQEEKSSKLQKQIQMGNVVQQEDVQPSWMNPPSPQKQQILNSQNGTNNLKITSNNNNNNNIILQESNRQLVDKKIPSNNMNNFFLNPPGKFSNYQSISNDDELQFSQLQNSAIHMENNQSYNVSSKAKQKKDNNCFVALPKQPNIKSFFSKRQSIGQQRYSQVPLNKIDMYR